MSTRCEIPTCQRSGEWALTLTFTQAKPPGWSPEKGPPRIGLTLKTGGLYCGHHRNTLTLKELVPPPNQAKVDTWFLARSLGKCAHEDTQAHWDRAAEPAPEDVPSLLVKV